MYFNKQLREVYEELNSSNAGLSSNEANQRLEKFGKNQLAEGKKETLVQRFFKQFLDPMVIVLIIAAIISGALEKEFTNMSIILFVVIVNAILGTLQESKAEKAIDSLKKMSAPFAKVLRDNHVQMIKAEELVVGDIVHLDAGDSIPADIRLTEAASLKVEEAALTGESVPVEKNLDVIDSDAVPLGDRKNMAYLGSNVTYGRGVGIVVGTGMNTEMGKIANIISNTKEEKTPLQKKLSDLSKILSVIVLIISAVIFVIGIIRNGGFYGGHVVELFMTAISLAVAAIPEGLVAVVTVVLSVGVTKMAKRNAIIRKLPAVETLGCAQIICSDKTGTLTQNKMTVVEAMVGGEYFKIGEDSKNGGLKLLAMGMTLCNDSKLSDDGSSVGDPTETALTNFGLHLDMNKNKLEAEFKRVGEAPFDSMRKLMSTVHQSNEGIVQYTKGAPDELLRVCTRYFDGTTTHPLTDEIRQMILSANNQMANKALRVLAAAYKMYDEIPTHFEAEAIENNLVFIGLTGMIDPVRPDVKDAIRKCKTASIKTVMITGDHIDTAIAIAKDLDILKDTKQAITGRELDQISDEDFITAVERYSVYARVQPEHKVRIVKAWKDKGLVTAMTGDGVNDAPALKTADIGVGMGITGTDVSKSVSSIVLADDNFSTIVSAVEEGRKIYANLRKAIHFLLSTNMSEVASLFVASIFNIQLMLPIHILWVNLVTDTFPALALGLEEGEENIMTTPPRKAHEPIFAGGMGFKIAYQGLVLAALTLIAYFIGLRTSETTAMTMAFTVLSFLQLFHSVNMRTQTQSIFTRHKKMNKFLFGAIAASLLLTLAIIYVPGINDIFKVTPLSFSMLITTILLSVAVIPIVEIVKLFERKIGRN